MKSNILTGESKSNEDFDYENIWGLMDRCQQNKHHIRAYDGFDDEPIEHPLLGLQPEIRANQDRFTLEMDDDEYEAYREFISSFIEASEFAPLIGINEKDYVSKLIIKNDPKNNREIEVKEAGFKDRLKHASWYPQRDIEELNGVLLDVSAFNTHDFLKDAPEFDMARYKLEKRQQYLKDLLLEFTSIQNMSKATYENLKRKILRVHDEIHDLKEQRFKRLCKVQEEFKQE